ncbi:MAG TPA: hypothetical protein VE990_12475 [Acidimicrobiales bacterium]|nr:hypothetical protein [Acidimicrobiales bacterium]
MTTRHRQYRETAYLPNEDLLLQVVKIEMDEPPKMRRGHVLELMAKELEDHAQQLGLDLTGALWSGSSRPWRWGDE